MINKLIFIGGLLLIGGLASLIVIFLLASNVHWLYGVGACCTLILLLEFLYSDFALKFRLK